MAKHDISKHPIHLGLGATVEVEPEFNGTMDWYMGYAERHAGDGADARLVSMYTFSESWDTWEMHPEGSEVVLGTEGSLTLQQEKKDRSQTGVTISAGEYAVNEPGTWHTADVSGTATALFITAGRGTQHRPR